MRLTLTGADSPRALYLRLLVEAPVDALRLAALIAAGPSISCRLSNKEIAVKFGWDRPELAAGKLRAQRAVSWLVANGYALQLDRAGFAAHLRDVRVFRDPADDRDAKAELRDYDAKRFLVPLWWTPLP